MRTGRPPIAPPQKKMEHRLDDIEALLAKLVKGREETAERSDAFARFQTTGERALPMTTAHVALVLDSTTQGVQMMVYRGELNVRFQAKARFHPDDVREYLKRTNVLQARSA